MSDEYAHLLVKDFGLWGVYVHENQSYLGRCVVWCHRADARELTDATGEEYEQLLTVLRALRHASVEVCNPDWFNYAFLGNETRHLHGHFIPRYKEAREYRGIFFTDDRWGHNYQTNYEFITPPEVLENIRHALQQALK